jgi:hypothetical protein
MAVSKKNETRRAKFARIAEPWRSSGMIPDKTNRPGERQPKGSENPIWQLAPVGRMDCVKVFRINKLP